MNNLAKKNDKKYKYFIYKIYNPECDYIYVGSTRDMVSRKNKHKSTCNNVNTAGYNYKIYRTIRENDGFENWYMVLLEVMPDVTKLTAEMREDYYRVELNATLNSRSATRGNITVAEYHKEYDKIYRIENKENIQANKNQKNVCQCGGKFTKQNKSQHNKTNKHQKYLNNLNI